MTATVLIKIFYCLVLFLCTISFAAAQTNVNGIIVDSLNGDPLPAVSIYFNGSQLYRLIEVSNPYRAPCARAYSLIEELANDNEEMSVQVIFTATEDKSDIRRAPATYLMANAAKGDEVLIKYRH